MTRRCDAVVYRRDTYRVARDGKRHFAMHYQQGQCERPARPDGDLCTQHAKIEARHSSRLLRWSEKFRY